MRSTTTWYLIALAVVAAAWMLIEDWTPVALFVVVWVGPVLGLLIAAIVHDIIRRRRGLRAWPSLGLGVLLLVAGLVVSPVLQGAWGLLWALFGDPSGLGVTMWLYAPVIGLMFATPAYVLALIVGTVIRSVRPMHRDEPSPGVAAMP